MVRKIFISAILACALLAVSGCHHKTQNPLANIDSKQPDKALFDRAMDSMKHGHYQESRTLLDTLINTYPDSEYIARAKLGIGDAWYNEGGTAAWQQAEMQYKDFQIFFPDLPEASEAQLKVAFIHYRQMEKPDRDFAQAQRAAEEYKILISQYPQSPLLPEAKQRLREVQEVLAERQFRIAHFYYLRDNLAASQARLHSLIDSYPLYSSVDEALFELGQLYEKEAVAMRKQDKLNAATREKLTADFEREAIQAYSQVVSRYPAMPRVEDAKKRLVAMKATVPVPTAEAIATNKSEMQSRSDERFSQRMLGNFRKHPSVARASKVGDPNMADEEVRSAPAMVQSLNAQILGTPVPPPSGKIGIDTAVGKTGDPGASEAPPSSQSKEGAPPKPAPAQVNELQKPADPTATPAATQSGQSAKTDDKDDSSSKKKVKKGLRKLIPF